MPVDVSTSFVFNDEHKANVEAFLEKELGRDSLAAYVFSESVRKHKIASEIGESQVRHCPLSIRLGIIVHAKMGYAGGVYDLLAKIMGLPSKRRLHEYTIPTTNDTDGILIANVLKAMQDFDAKNLNAPHFAWMRHATMVFGSMTCKGRLDVNFHTNKIVGMTEDALKTDVILSYLKEL